MILEPEDVLSQFFLSILRKKEGKTPKWEEMEIGNLKTNRELDLS